jgi:glutamate-1-semialdehyde 2,1-aminomutase
MPDTISVSDYSQHDRRIWDEELCSFVPNKIFDAHIHLFHPDHLPAQHRNKAWSLADLATLRTWAARLYPDREVHFLGLGTPIVGIDCGSHNGWCIDQVKQDPSSRLNVLVTPQCPLEKIQDWVQQPSVIGLKPYRCFSVTGDVDQCRIQEFLPHEQLELANHFGLVVTMHLSRFLGCADQENLADLTEYTQRRYPRIRWILAHCGRSFTYWPIRQAIDRLRDLPNLWYDVSAVTDVRPLITLFSREDHRRILYGSDGVDATYFHGQYAALGRAWHLVGTHRFDMQFPHCDARPILAIYEQLLSMKHAVEIANWSVDQVEDLFWHNSQRLLGFDQSPGEKSLGQDPMALYERAKKRIPGGTQLLSKRPEMYAPQRWPAYYRQARGCEVIDTAGRRWIDMTTSGIGSCLLGYADPDVTRAVQQRVARGSMATLNAPEEMELAERLIALHPWAEQVRYARTGGESMAMAVRIARAVTGRDMVAFCGYHGWSDWYLAANRTPGGSQDQLQSHLLPGLDAHGVPAGLAGTALPFDYNRLDQLKAWVDQWGDRLAAIVLEPTRTQEPAPGFLEGVRQLADRCGAVMILDEISSGWRLHLGGAHVRYGIEPDMAVFAKAISNGHPMAAIVGRATMMEGAQRSFISSTYWTEAVGPAAALATISKFESIDVVGHVRRIGQSMRDGWVDLGRRWGVPVKVDGHPALLHLGFDHPQAHPIGTLVTVLMLEKGYLTGSGFYPSLAHSQQHVAGYLDGLSEVFAEVARMLERKELDARLAQLGSAPRHTGFTRLA